MGYFLVLIVFMVLGIVFAKRGAAGWILYTVGAVLQFISQIGRQRQLAYYGFGASYMAPTWIIFLVILAVSAVIIVVRRSKPD